MTDFDLVGELECIWEVRATCGEGPLWICLLYTSDAADE